MSALAIGNVYSNYLGRSYFFIGIFHSSCQIYCYQRFSWKMLRSKSEPNKCPKCVHVCRTQTTRSNAQYVNMAYGLYVTTTYGRVHISEYSSIDYSSVRKTVASNDVDELRAVNRQRRCRRRATPQRPTAQPTPGNQARTSTRAQRGAASQEQRGIFYGKCPAAVAAPCRAELAGGAGVNLLHSPPPSS